MLKKKSMFRVLSCVLTFALLVSAGTITAFAMTPEERLRRLEQMTWTVWIPGAQESTHENPEAQEAAPARAPAMLTADELKAYAQKVFELVNDERANVGAAPLAYREDVAEAAQVRAREIAESYSHTRPDGRWFSTVLSEFGIARKSSGENAYKGPVNPERAMRGWMESDGHRTQLLKERHTAMGAGVYQCESGALHWVQLFIRE